jgi:hypothetical protein
VAYSTDFCCKHQEALGLSFLSLHANCDLMMVSLSYLPPILPFIKLHCELKLSPKLLQFDSPVWTDIVNLRN